MIERPLSNFRFTSDSFQLFPKKFGLLLVGILCTLLLRGQVVFDAASSNLNYQPSPGVTSVTKAHTTGSSSNRFMLVSVFLSTSAGAGLGATTVSSVTYNGVALTYVAGSGQNATGDKLRVEYWQLINPPTGTFNVVATCSATIYGISMGTLTFSGVDQTTPLGTLATAMGNSATPTVAVVGATNDIVCDAVGFTTTLSPTVGSGQTSRWSQNLSDSHNFGSTKAGAAFTTMSWTLLGPYDWVSLGVAVKAVSVPQDVSLTLAMTGNRTTVLPGQNIIYTLTLTNTGAGTATNVKVKDHLPAGVNYVSATPSAGTYDSSTGIWTVPSIATGSQTLAITVTAQ